MNTNPPDQDLLRAINQRYADGYKVAQVTNIFAAVLQIVSKIAMVLFGLLGLFFGYSTGGIVVAIFMGLGGVAAGSVFLLYSVLINASGRSLMANLDCAVCSSPFLTDRLKAITMGLSVR